jgi:hypothetical protein
MSYNIQRSSSDSIHQITPEVKPETTATPNPLKELQKLKMTTARSSMPSLPLSPRKEDLPGGEKTKDPDINLEEAFLSSLKKTHSILTIPRRRESSATKLGKTSQIENKMAGITITKNLEEAFKPVIENKTHQAVSKMEASPTDSSSEVTKNEEAEAKAKAKEAKALKLCTKLFEKMGKSQERTQDNINSPKEILFGYKAVMSSEQLFKGLSNAYNETTTPEKKCELLAFASSWVESGTSREDLPKVESILKELIKSSTSNNNPTEITVSGFTLMKSLTDAKKMPGSLSKSYQESTTDKDKYDHLQKAISWVQDGYLKDLGQVRDIRDLISQGKADPSKLISKKAEELAEMSKPIMDKIDPKIECKTVAHVVNHLKTEKLVAKEFGDLISQVHSKATIASLLLSIDDKGKKAMSLEDAKGFIKKTGLEDTKEFIKTGGENPIDKSQTETLKERKLKLEIAKLAVLEMPTTNPERLELTQSADAAITYTLEKLTKLGIVDDLKPIHGNTNPEAALGLAIMKASTNLTNGIIEDILTQTSGKDAQERCAFYLDVAAAAQKNKDVATLAAVYSALDSAPINRIFMKKGIKDSETKYNLLAKANDPNLANKNLRKLYDSNQSGPIAHFISTDFTFVKEGNPETKRNPETKDDEYNASRIGFFAKPVENASNRLDAIKKRNPNPQTDLDLTAGKAATLEQEAAWFELSKKLVPRDPTK